MGTVWVAMGACQHDPSLATVCRKVVEVETRRLIQTPEHGRGGWAMGARHRQYTWGCSVQKATNRGCWPTE